MHSAILGEARRGAQPRVVFLHGLFGRGKNFTSIAAALAPEAMSLLVDLPNHGRSGWTDQFDYLEIADLVAQHLREGFAADGPVDVVGHSMGGKVAMVLALRHPGLVRRLVVIDIAPVGGAASRGNFRQLLDALAEVRLERLERRADADVVLRERIPEDAVRGFLLQNLRRDGDGFRWEPNLALLRAELDAVMGFPDTGDLRFTGPVLWIGGERSDYVADGDEPSMRALFPRTRRVTVRGAGHWVHADAPDIVVEALRRFLISDAPAGAAAPGSSGDDRPRAG
ncbi:alpha/beta fold hydrolase [Leucobacter sp. wl10]|nr:alpha/beta fold hydrolase [Leucobacter sp. wl10]RGE17667.1 alpha/beta fold hydrolase [Leucobacter sp. wl10]